MRRTLFYVTVALLTCGSCFYSQNVLAQSVNVKTQDNNYKISCKDENLLLVWDEIKNEFKKKSTGDLTVIRVNNCTNLVKFKQVIDLNEDGQKELVIYKKIDCSATINCKLWIFQKEKKKYQAILEADNVERFTPEKTKNNDYREIQLRTHITGTSHYFQLFKFNGKKYAAQKAGWKIMPFPIKKEIFTS